MNFLRYIRLFLQNAPVVLCALLVCPSAATAGSAKPDRKVKAGSANAFNSQCSLEFLEKQAQDRWEQQRLCDSEENPVRSSNRPKRIVREVGKVIKHYVKGGISLAAVLKDDHDFRPFYLVPNKKGLKLKYRF